MTDDDRGAQPASRRAVHRGQIPPGRRDARATRRESRRRTGFPLRNRRRRQDHRCQRRSLRDKPGDGASEGGARANRVGRKTWGGQVRAVSTRTRRNSPTEAVVYWYAWKGGPRMPGPPGSAAFRKAYQAALTGKAAEPPPQPRHKAATVQTVVDGYLDSVDFLTQLKQRTQRDYRGHARRIVKQFGDLSLDAFVPEAADQARGRFLRWRDEFAKASPRQADYAWSVLSAILSWAKMRGEIKVNPCLDAGSRSSTTRRAPTRSGTMPGSLHSTPPPRTRSRWRWRWRCGPDSGRAISCA